jgi:chromosome segregation ATPase
VDDRSKRRALSRGEHDRFARHPTLPGSPVGGAVPEAIEDTDESQTPSPTTVDELREWRRVEERVSKTELGLSAYTQSHAHLEAQTNQFVVPAVKRMLGQLDEMGTTFARLDGRLETFFEEQWPELHASVKDAITRLQRVELKQDQLALLIAQHNERIAKAEHALTEIETRVAKLERRNDDAALASNTIKAERTRWFSWAKAAYAVAGALAGIGAYLVGTNL